MSNAFSRRLILTGAAGGFTLLTAGTAASSVPPQRVVHAAGETVLTSVPKRVVVFDLGALDVLDALGVQPAGVAGGRFPGRLAGYGAETYAKVGTLFEPDYAAVRAARPDLIIVGGRSASNYAELNAIAPTLDLSTSTTGFIGSVVRNILLLGRIFDRRTEASASAERLLSAIGALHARTKGQDALVLFAAGSGVQPQAPYTRFGVIYEVLGMQPVATPFDLPPSPPRSEAGSLSDADRARLSADQAAALAVVMDRDPDWLFVLDRASATGGEPAAPALLAASQAISRSRAWREDRVVHLDAPGWYLVGGGPSTLEASIAQIASAIGAPSRTA